MLGNPAFQRWASTFPLTRFIAARRAKALFDLTAGFVYSQVLHACVTVKLFEALAGGPVAPERLAGKLALPLPGLKRLLSAAEGLKLVESRPGGLVGLGIHGAAYLGNPAVEAMVLHHALLYRDLADPVALLRGDTATALAAFWPYAGAAPGAPVAAPEAAAYSALMSVSQDLIADDVLDAFSLPRTGALLDIGGGEGRFLIACAKRRPHLRLTLFDLPSVAARAPAAFEAAGLGPRVTCVGGDFKLDILPRSDVTSLVRVVHDHDDVSAQALLAKVFDALAPGGILLLAEPLAATKGAEAVGSYFEFYLLAMRQGRPRGEATLRQMLHVAGFVHIRRVATARPLLTSLIVAEKAAS